MSQKQPQNIPSCLENPIHSSILVWRIHGQRSLAGYSPWNCKQLDLTQHTCTLTSRFPELGIESNGNKEWKCSLEENTTDVSFLWLSRFKLLVSLKDSFPLAWHIFFPFSSILSITEGLLEKAMAPHSSILAWKIPWTEEPGGLQSIGSWRVGHDWATSLSLFTFMHWARKWQPTPVFLPGWAAIYGVTQNWTRTKQLSSSSRGALTSKAMYITVYFLNKKLIYFPVVYDIFP